DAHRTGGVDDDDLAGITAAGTSGLPGALALDRHDGIHIGAAVGQELVLVDGGGEGGHQVSRSRWAAGSRRLRWTVVGPKYACPGCRGDPRLSVRVSWARSRPLGRVRPGRPPRWVGRPLREVRGVVPLSSAPR